MKMKNTKITEKVMIILLLVVPILFSCSTSHEAQMPVREMQPDLSTSDSTYIISSPLVEKKFVMKNGKEMEFTEWYIRRSVQDYYIKFCESTITRKDLENALNAQGESLHKILKLEIQYKEGTWDICDDNLMQQSRIGKYVIIHKIIEE